MKKTWILFLICLAAVTTGYAQTKQDMITELFVVMHQDSVMDKTFSNITNTMMAQVQVQAKDSASRSRSMEMMKITMPLLKDILRKMDVDLISIYDFYFTEPEIKDFLDFYKSPSGQKFVRTTPSIQKELLTVMYQKYMPEMQKIIKEKTEELKAKEKK